MLPLLLLLLPPELLASQVCFNISNGTINMNLRDENLEVIDSKHMGLRCMKEQQQCYIECKSNDDESNPMFNFTGCRGVTFSSSNGVLHFNIDDLGHCTVYSCNVNEILPLIKALNHPHTYQKGMMKLLHIRESCRQLFSKNHELMKVFIIIERTLIHNIMRISQVEAGGSRYYNLKALALNVVSISQANLSSSPSNGRIQIEVPQLLPQNKSFIPETWLPVDALQDIPEEERTVGLVSYIWHDEFQFEQEDISSMVIRIELLGEEHFHDLITPLKIIFNLTAHTDMANDSRLQCHYFNENEWLWKTDGCETYNSTYNNTELECSCNHTTPFAVLLIRDPIAEVHWRILSVISYIGCSLSAFFTALSVVMYIIRRNHREDYSTAIHVSLSGALFLLNTSFLLTEWGATMKLDWVCVFIAAVTHYSLLCTFTWMAIEALHVYLLLIKVYNTYYKHYLIKLSLAGWGIPGVIVGISVGVMDVKQFYGIAELTMADTNQTNAICWITDDSFFYGVNLVYFTLIFVFNSGILVAVVSSICKMRGTFKHKPGAQRDPAGLCCTDGLTVMGLTCLLGITWGLAFLGSGHVNYPILYLFCILNSIQGFLIFLWICGSTRKQRKRAIEARSISTPMKSSEIKSN